MKRLTLSFVGLLLSVTLLAGCGSTEPEQAGPTRAEEVDDIATEFLRNMPFYENQGGMAIRTLTQSHDTDRCEDCWTVTLEFATLEGKNSFQMPIAVDNGVAGLAVGN